ncbi:MAG TPA: virulence RhuM family protein [Myxococcota bacterium]|nr:virulence RhuM family protein [Myxococcota bacterium]
MDDAPRTEIVLYRTEDGRNRIQCRLQDESIWLTQALMAELFDKDVRTINEHLRNIFDEGELAREATIRNFRIVRTEGNREVSREVEHYSLPVILAVGYRVRSARGTQFRQWATACLTEFLVKGFVMDDERLKNPPSPDVPDYFDELLERIRDIRASERRMYLRVRDILALAADYRQDDAATQAVFAVIQNKLHFASTGMTAPELIARRADAALPNMGLTSWRGDRVKRTDVTVAKNYLTATEIDELNRIVVMFLDYAEDQARRRKQVFLADWQARLDDFLRFNQRDVLEGAGTVRREDADRQAQQAFEQFAQRRRTLAEDDGQDAALRQLEAAAAKRVGAKAGKRKRKDATP